MITLDRIYDVQADLERMKSLDEIDVIKNLKVEFQKLNSWHKELDEA